MISPPSNETQLNRATRIIKFHDLLLERVHGNPLSQGWQTAGWSSRHSQLARFKSLIKVSGFEGGAVLDWGCGTGDLFAHLSATGVDFEYYGLDINPKMIEIAEKRFGKRFEVVKLDHRLEHSYDYVFASGLFQFPDPQSPRYWLDLIEHMYSSAKTAVAANFLSALREKESMAAEELYLDPLDTVRALNHLSNRWALDHTYHAGGGDFTIGLIRPETGPHWRRPDFNYVR